MTILLDFIKRNWLSLVLASVVVYMILGQRQTTPLLRNELMSVGQTSSISAPTSMGKGISGVALDSFRPVVAPVSQTDRMVIQDTNLSMQVKDVAAVEKEINKIAVQAGGFMINQDLSVPEGAASGSISIRVPIEKRDSVLDDIKKTSVKIVSEVVYGTDVTDQYVDLDTRIASLEKTKSKMETILDQAVKVSDLIEVQAQIDNLQQQIDSLKGQQKYLSQTAKLTKITIYLSTDEFALPYTPDTAWRPAVVIKNATRSMISSLRGFANGIIWIAIYAPIWGTILIVLVVAKKLLSKKTVS